MLGVRYLYTNSCRQRAVFPFLAGMGPFCVKGVVPFQHWATNVRVNGWAVMVVPLGDPRLHPHPSGTVLFCPLQSHPSPYKLRPPAHTTSRIRSPPPNTVDEGTTHSPLHRRIGPSGPCTYSSPNTQIDAFVLMMRTRSFLLNAYRLSYRPHSSNHSPFADLLCNNNVRDECAHNGQKANIPFVDDQE